MHKRGIFSSKMFNGVFSNDHLMAAECNCVYWHGMFGGIYLPHLRDAIYKELILAQKKKDIEYPLLVREDIDMDGKEELFFSDGVKNIFFKNTGGIIAEWDFLDKEINILNVVSRRPELYHKEAYEKLGEKNINYDIHRRYSFIDRFISTDCTISQFFSGKYGEQSSFYDEPYNISKFEEKIIVFEKCGFVVSEDGLHKICITKEFKIIEKGLNISVKIHNMSGKSADFWYGNEINLSFVSPFEGFIIEEKCDGISFKGRGIELVLTSDSDLSLWGYPIKTVSRNHHEFEEIFQGGCYFMHKKIKLKAGEYEIIKFQLIEKETKQ